VDAVSEALFATAEEQQSAFERLAVPTGRGSGAPDAVRRFVRDRLTPWFDKKCSALDATRLAYKRVAEVEPDPSPRWLVAATERTATMLVACADEFDGSIEPLAGSTEDTAAFRQLVRGTSERIRFDADDALRACVSYAERYRIDDDHVRRCRSRLTRDP
jgi:hypothetical protein